MWKDGFLASPAVQAFAESGDTVGFDVEAQAYGGIRDTFTAAPISGGLGKTASNFFADGTHTLVIILLIKVSRAILRIFKCLDVEHIIYNISHYSSQ